MGTIGSLVGTSALGSQLLTALRLVTHRFDNMKRSTVPSIHNKVFPFDCFQLAKNMGCLAYVDLAPDDT